ncbi:ATP-binding protein [Streptomyces sp. NPDC096191]|uniref:ATP-binding protein n=1 Tax=Streptomyces sp. NPDC096191 TaxID=3155426 RepID=UPI00332B6858
MKITTPSELERQSHSGLRVRSSSLLLQPAQRPAAAARRHAETVLTRWDMPRPQIEDALVVVTELVTNAEQHAPGGPVELHLFVRASSLLISVHDVGPAVLPPAPAGPCHEGERGRGLSIVRALTSSFGYVHTRTGKTVWAWITAPAS